MVGCVHENGARPQIQTTWAQLPVLLADKAPSRCNRPLLANTPRPVPIPRPVAKPIHSSDPASSAHNGNKPTPTAPHLPSTIRNPSIPIPRRNKAASQSRRAPDASTGHKLEHQPT